MSNYKVSKNVRDFGGKNAIINKCVNGYFLNDSKGGKENGRGKAFAN